MLDKTSDKTPAKPAEKKEPVVVKKYANRRLYNTETSTYVTLDDLAGNQTVLFAGFTNLVEVRWSNANCVHQFDNITLQSPAIPGNPRRFTATHVPESFDLGYFGQYDPASLAQLAPILEVQQRWWLQEQVRKGCADRILDTGVAGHRDP